MNDSRLQFEGATLNFRDEGRGPAVVLVHGWALDLEQWSQVAIALRDAFRVVRFDRPGFGRSGGAPSIEADTRAIAALVDGLGLGRVALVGASQGARSVLRYALDRPATVAALVLDGAPLEGALPGPRVEDTAPLDQLAALAAAGDLQAVRDALATHPFFMLRSADPGASARLREMLQRYSGADLGPPPRVSASPGTATAAPGGITASGAIAAPAASTAPAPNVAARLGELTMPALVLNGEFDTAHRRLAGDALAYGLPRAERAVLAGAGHLACLDRPGEYAGRLRDFLTLHLLTPPEHTP
jgi:pimeloyl-ACP methyl ester carboxylesterase